MESSKKAAGHRTSILKMGSSGAHHELGGDHVKFDEVTIAEHDKDRGTRTKIEEPKTPYEQDQEMGDVED